MHPDQIRKIDDLLTENGVNPLAPLAQSYKKKVAGILESPDQAVEVMRLLLHARGFYEMANRLSMVRAHAIRELGATKKPSDIEKRIRQLADECKI